MKQFDIHPIQAEILRNLLFGVDKGFSELNNKRYGTDLFSFYLKQLVRWKLVIKEGRRYVLTDVGKEFANRFDTDKIEVEKQAKIGVLMVGIRQLKGKTYYLLQQRLKQPYYGYWGFFGGKIKWGETILEAAEREMMEETNLQGKLEIVAIKHKMDYDQNNNLLEDKYFWVIVARDLKGKFKEKFEGGRNKWMTREEINRTENIFDGLLENLEIIDKTGFQMSEKKYVVKGF